MHVQLQRKRSSQGSIDSFIGDEAFKGTFAHHRDYNYSNFLKEIGESTQISEIIILMLQISKIILLMLQISKIILLMLQISEIILLMLQH